jgi:predicted dehydrogenase
LKNTRIAIIGMGSIGQRHYRNLKKLGYSNVQGWDSDLTKGSPVDWGWKPDVALVCTPPDSHVDYGFLAVSMGVKGLFIEKPLADSMQSVSALIEHAKSHGVITMVGCNWRWGWLRLGWPKSKDYMTYLASIPNQRDIIYDVAIHLLDLDKWMRGKGIAMRSSLNCTGLRVTIFHSPGWTEIIVPAKPLDYLFGGWLGVLEDASLSEKDYWWDGKDSRWPWGFKRNNMYLDEMRHFMGCIERDEQPMNPISEAAETLRLALEVRDVR